MPNNTITKPIPVPISADPIPSPVHKKPELERYSEDPGKVIPSCGLSYTETLDLIDLHHSAQRARSKRERYDRYIMILSDHPKDYLAAYEASRSAYGMTEYEKSLHWLNKALEIFPQYNPARSFKKKIEGGLKRTAE